MEKSLVVTLFNLGFDIPSDIQPGLINLYIREKREYFNLLTHSEKNELSEKIEEQLLKEIQSNSNHSSFEIILPEILIHFKENDLLDYLNVRKEIILKNKIDTLFIEAIANNKQQIIDFFLYEKQESINTTSNIQEIIRRIKDKDNNLAMNIIMLEDYWINLSENNNQILVKTIINCIEDPKILFLTILNNKIKNPLIINEVFLKNFQKNDEKLSEFLIENYSDCLDIKKDNFWHLYKTIIDTRKDDVINNFVSFVYKKYKNLNINNDKNTLLSFAIKNLSVSAVHRLLEYGADTNYHTQNIKKPTNIIKSIKKKEQDNEYSQQKIKMMELLLEKFTLSNAVSGQYIHLDLSHKRI